MANTVAYEWPVVGATAPTAAQSRRYNTVSAIVTGDGATTTVVITHNWGVPTVQVNGGPYTGPFPEIYFESLLAAGYTAAPLITNVNKTANAVTLTVTAFTGAGLRVRLKRPTSLEL